MPSPRSPGARLRDVLILIVLLTGCGLWQMSQYKPLPVNNPDGIEYLGAAYNLMHRGVHSVAPPDQPPAPSNFREPLLAVVLAGMMLADPGLEGLTADCIFNAAPGCAAQFRHFQALNVVAALLAALLLAAAARTLTGSRLAGLVAALAVALNPSLLTTGKEIVSDYVALAFLAAAVLAAAVGLRRRQPGWALPCGVALGLLALTKAIFLYFIVLALLGLGAAALACRGARRVLAVALVLLALGALPPVGAWMARNAAAFGTPSLTEGRGSLVLAHRVLLDEMTAGEYAIAFLWWTRGVGDDIARALLPADSYERFNLHVETGWQKGGDALWRSTIARLAAERGIGEAAAEREARSLFIGRILSDPVWHAAVTLPVFYRGLWVDTWILLSFPALVACLWSAVRRKDAALLAVLAPGLFCLLVHALLTPNVPRFQIPAETAFALALAWAAAGWQARRHGRGTTG